LGVLVVVNAENSAGRRVILRRAAFRRRGHISVRDSQLQSFLEIPVSEITSAQAEESHHRWFLRITWENKTAVFAYRGVFAEHLARVAETTIRSVLRPALRFSPSAAPPAPDTLLATFLY